MENEVEKVFNLMTKLTKRCQHNKFIINPTLGYVECGLCGEHLNPMWVIEQYANAEHRLFKQYEYLQRLISESKHKTKCKCEHCGKMTKTANKSEVNKAFFG